LNHQSVRKGVTNARFNESSSTILFVEITFVAIFIGMASKSWWAFGAALISLFIAINYKPLALVLAVLLSIAWGAIGAAIGTAFESTGAAVVLGVLGFLIGLGTHLSGLEWAQDIGNSN
jgi:4-hydroxybenzoate polyprenyltransferase